MAKINSINNSSGSLNINEVSLDSSTQFSIAATPKFISGVAATDDSFRISQGSSLGTNDCMKIHSTGEITQPLQSSFCALVGSTVSNVTGDNSTYNIIPNIVIWDQNSDYNNANGVFTAPKTGKFLFTASVTFDDMTSGYTAFFNAFDSSNRTARLWSFNNIGGTGIFTNECVSVGSVVLDMDVADICKISCRVYGSTKTVDVYSSGSTDLDTSFSGCLLC